jgi:lipoyl(octanoyl) transferase
MLRVLRDPPGPAAWNMGVDDALLQLGGPPTLRLYGWSPPAVSLGWFQRLADFADLPAGTVVVRRLTGGGAIHHGDELTFALVLPADRLPRDVAASYVLVHDAVVAALAAIGVPCERVLAGKPPGARPEARWCFAAAGRSDLVTPAGKLLGSAQRRISVPQPRVLHHGSLVLHRPALTPFVAAVDDLASIDAAHRDRLQAAVVAHLAAALEMTPQPGILSAAERALAGRLAEQRYGDPAFTANR